MAKVTMQNKRKLKNKVEKIKIFGSFFYCLLPMFLIGCVTTDVVKKTTPETKNTPVSAITEVKNLSLPKQNENQQLLEQSWLIYKQRFIQADGRVIDREAGDRSTSEGQAYALLRAVLSDDPKTFALILNWAENNLHRKGGTSTILTNGKHSDNLWVWKWGKDDKGAWGVLDANFASDADIDAITALIFAARRWQRPEYLQLAKTKLKDLWNLSTIEGKNGDRYLLPGPLEAFQKQPAVIQLNPSYLAPYAFRLFAQVDPTHNWLSLVDSSYYVLTNSPQISSVNLPSDWVLFNIQSNQFQALPDSSSTSSLYGFDAYRVWWRLALDAAWFKEPRALQILQKQLAYLQQQWRSQQKIPAQINLKGEAFVNYEATSQYAMLYPAFQLIEPEIAQAILQSKLLPSYRNGIWDNDSAYYVQNLAWLGLMSPSSVTSELLNP